MAHIKTKDPFGFVGSHVVRKNRLLSAGGFSGFGGVSSSAAESGEDEHGWITRYDARLDSYTLFIPGKGPSAYTRGDIMKLIADPNFHVQNDDDDEFPAPVEDTRSRYVGVPMVKNVGDGCAIKGAVRCYLPFADLYKVVYEDESMEEVSEDAIINSMILMLTTQAHTTLAENIQPQGVSKKRKRVDVPAVNLPPTPPSSLSVPLPPATVRSVSAPATPSLSPPSMMPVSFSPLLRMGGSPVVTHSNILELSGSSVSMNENAAAALGTPRAAAVVPPAVSVQSAQVNQAAPPPPSVDPTPAALFIKNEPRPEDVVMLIDDEPSVEMIPLDADDVIMQPVESSVPSASSPLNPSRFYLIPPEATRYEPIEPLEKRSVAYGYLRQELLNMLDRKEASAKKIAIQYDILRNPDIKHQNAIRRFMETSGLVVLNHLIKVYSAGKDLGLEPYGETVLLLFKIVAMLPTPTQDQVISSGIGKTIGYLSRSQPPPPFTNLPKSINHLAKWIRAVWSAKVKRDPDHKQKMAAIADARAKSGRPSKHLGARTPPGSSVQRQMPPIEIPKPIEVDTTPIPRRANRPVLPNPTSSAASRPPLAPPADLSLPLSNAGSRKMGNLKPDWMRQKENLSRTRFSIGGDSAAEFNHYKRRNGVATPAASGIALGSASHTNILSLSASSENPASYHGENEQAEGAGGERGTYGRRQRITFGSRWSVVEFHRDSPPDAVRPTLRFHSQQPQRYGRPRSILRQHSKYRDDLGPI
uniref:TFIIS N-terminal domain-containing protein n=1 Tax=Globisporangium ultimum (strain ATCC 200006 / CBS 805.95 / DAOM BR144) TaxID=431595 RepID=K3WY87_GLOUD